MSTVTTPIIGAPTIRQSGPRTTSSRTSAVLVGLLFLTATAAFIFADAINSGVLSQQHVDVVEGEGTHVRLVQLGQRLGAVRSRGQTHLPEVALEVELLDLPFSAAALAIRRSPHSSRIAEA